MHARQMARRAAALFLGFLALALLGSGLTYWHHMRAVGFWRGSVDGAMVTSHRVYASGIDRPLVFVIVAAFFLFCVLISWLYLRIKREDIARRVDPP